jgi:hypothetical protein
LVCSKFHSGDPQILGASVQNAVPGEILLPGLGMMTELVPSSEMRLCVCILGILLTLLLVFPHIRRGSFCYEFQININAFPVHGAHIQWNNKGYAIFLIWEPEA